VDVFLCHTVYIRHIPTNDLGGLCPVSQRFLVICPAVMVVADVRVRIDMSVIVMKPSTVDGLCVDVQCGRTRLGWTHFFQVGKSRKCCRIPGKHDGHQQQGHLLSLTTKEGTIPHSFPVPFSSLPPLTLP